MQVTPIFYFWRFRVEVAFGGWQTSGRWWNIETSKRCFHHLQVLVDERHRLECVRHDSDLVKLAMLRNELTVLVVIVFAFSFIRFVAVIYAELFLFVWKIM